MKYLVVKIEATAREVHLARLENVSKSFQLFAGASRAKDFPDDAFFRMHKDFPKALKLTDALDNLALVFVASARLVKALQSIPGALYNNELLSVKIVNHKGRQEKAEYTIVHQLNHIKCFKESACKGEKSPINPEQYDDLEVMVLDETKVDPKAMLFRPVEYPQVLLVRRDLAEKLEGEGFTGISFHEIKGYEFD